MVGRLVLVQDIGVRVPVRQPINLSFVFLRGFSSSPWFDILGDMRYWIARLSHPLRGLLFVLKQFCSV
jgi:hypothetical protein